MIQIDIKYKNKSGIYKLSIENHIYIGSSVNVYKRILRHYADLKRNNHDNTYLQRSINKYGIDNLKYEVLITFNEIEREELLKFEKYYIDFYNADLNLKKDQTTEYNCITTSKIVYQFNRFGELIKEWKSASEASRQLNVNPSNIHVCCLHPKRQQVCCNSLWSYNKEYPYYIKILYVFDLNGNFINRYYDTVGILELFPNSNRKNILTCIGHVIDSNKPYKNIYVSTNKNFKIPENYVPKYREKDELDSIFETNPIIYVYDDSNNLVTEQRLSSFKNINHVKRKIRNGCVKFRLNKEDIYTVRKKEIFVIDKNNNEYKFNNAVEAAIKLFNDKKQSKNIYKHIKRNTWFKGYLFGTCKIPRIAGTSLEP